MGTDLWRRAIKKEMTAVIPAFNEWTGGTVDDSKSNSELIGCQQIKCHMIFEIKMEIFTQKARFVTGGHTIEAPDSIKYLSFISCDSVRKAFLIAALTNIQICAEDAGNAYFNADCQEKIWTKIRFKPR